MRRLELFLEVSLPLKGNMNHSFPRPLGPSGRQHWPRVAEVLPEVARQT